MIKRALVVMRLVSTVGSALVGAREVRDMYDKRRGVWNVLRHLVRQQD